MYSSSLSREDGWNRNRPAQKSLLQHFESAGLEPHDAADSEFAQLQANGRPRGVR
jgi:hypothetical protein